nr:hypothetical protein MACL_00001221 [Theileria orientalis]
MRTRRSAKLIENTQSSAEIKEEDSVIDESHVLLDFKEFHSTEIFQDKESLNKTSDTKYDGDSNSGNKIRYWFTDKSVEFNTDK